MREPVWALCVAEEGSSSYIKSLFSNEQLRIVVQLTRERCGYIPSKFGFKVARISTISTSSSKKLTTVAIVITKSPRAYFDDLYVVREMDNENTSNGLFMEPAL